MTRKTYKTTDSNVLHAFAVYAAQVEEVRNAGHKFAEHFGGKLILYNNVHGVRVAGLSFTPKKTSTLWTKPDSNMLNSQRPRQSLAKATPEERAELVKLKAEWKERFPKDKADFEPVLESMGTSFGNLFFSGYHFFEHEGVVYFSTETELKPCMVEILGSEFEAAVAAHRQAQEKEAA